MLGVLLIIFGYVLGSVPTGLLVARAYGADVRKVGSGNTGTANVLRSAGKTAALLTLVGDIIKGLAPVVIARLLVGDDWIVAGTALAVVVGHCWPVFLRFRGGKGVAPGAGTNVALAPLVGLGLFALWWVVAFAGRYTSLAAVVVTLATPLAFWLTGQPAAYMLYTVVGGAVVLWRHRENIKALIKGEERKVGQKAKLRKVNH